MASYNDLEQYLNSDSSNPGIASLSDYSAVFHPKKLMIEEVDEVIITVSNLNNHPSLATAEEFGPEDPLTILQPRLDTCLEKITNEHIEEPFNAIRRYCESIRVETLYRPKYEYVLTGTYILFQKIYIEKDSKHCFENLHFIVEFCF